MEALSPSSKWEEELENKTQSLLSWCQRVVGCNSIGKSINQIFVSSIWQN